MRLTVAVEKQKAKAKQWGFGESPEKKTPYLWIEYLFLDITGENGEELTVIDRMYLTEKNFEYVLRDLQTLGWYGKNIFDLEPGYPDSYDLSQKVVLVSTEVEKYTNSNGDEKQKAKVTWVNDPDYVGESKIDAKEIKKLNEKLRGKLMAYRQKNGDKPAPVAAKKKDEDDAEMPF